jgi:hypothetical protein
LNVCLSSYLVPFSSSLEEISPMRTIAHRRISLIHRSSSGFLRCLAQRAKASCANGGARPTDKHGFQVGAHSNRGIAAGNDGCPPGRRGENCPEQKFVFGNFEGGAPQVCRGAGPCLYGSIGLLKKKFAEILENFRNLADRDGAAGGAFRYATNRATGQTPVWTANSRKAW